MSIQFTDVELKSRGFGPLNLNLSSGEVVLLCGLSGSGKSTLCSMLCGRLEPDSGTIHRDPEIPIGFVAHDFENQLIGSTVGEELVLSGAAQFAEPEVLRALEELESSLGELLSLDPQEISAAQQQILLLCSLVRSGARLIVLDESLSHLDPPSTGQFLRLVHQLAEVGVSFLLASHEPSLLEEVTRVLRLEAGRVVFTGSPSDFGDEERESAGFLPWHTILPENDRVASLVLKTPDLELPLGRSLVVSGLAASGKTRILNTLYGLDNFEGWELGSDEENTCLLRQRVGPSFWRSSVAEEWRASLNKALPTELRKLLEARLPDAFRRKRPEQLSHGQLRFTATLCLLAQNPSILFLDSPFQGLDGALRHALAECLRQFLSCGGRLILTTHSPARVGFLGDRFVWLEDGQLTRHGDIESW